MNDGQEVSAESLADPSRFDTVEHQAVWDEIIRAVGPVPLSAAQSYSLELICNAVCRLRMHGPNAELEKAVQWLLIQRGLELDPDSGTIRLAPPTTPGG